MMFNMLVLLLIGLSVTVQCQPHAHDIPSLSVNCNTCGGGPHAHGESFPACLETSRQCHHDEACMIKYGGAHIEIGCHKFHECHSATVDAVFANCPAGGREMHGGECRLCCEDDGCVTDTVTQIQEMQALTVACPEACSAAVENMADCLANAHHCEENQFCRVMTNEHGDFHAWCETKDHIQHCLDQKESGRCGHHHECVKECCTDTACMKSYFGLATDAPVVPTTPSTIPPDVTHAPTDAPVMETDAPVVETAAPVMTTAAPVVETDAPVMTTAAPVVETDAPAVETDAPAVTQAAPASTAAATCEDTIQNMSCSDVQEVCSSPLLVTFCQKFCKTC